MWILLLSFVGLFVILHIFLPRQYFSLRYYLLIRKIPALPKLPYIGSAHIILMPNEEFIPKLMKIFHDNKPIFNFEVLGVSNIFLSDLDDLAGIFNSRVHIAKGDDYEFLHPWLGTGLLTSSSEKWFHRRKLLTPSFHFQILEQYIDVLNKNALVLVEQFKNNVKNDFIEINEPMSLCTLDNICETAMGTAVNAQTGGEKEYVKAILRMSKIFQTRMLRPWLYRNFLFYSHPLGREQKRMLKILHGFTQKVILERKETYRKQKQIRKTEPAESDIYYKEKKKLSFLDVLIEISENQDALTLEEIREEVDTFMFEGHDTTAAALTWALFEMGHHPEIQEKAYQEQFEIFQGSRRAVTTADLHKMKYLDRVIKEALRLYPSVPLIARKLQAEMKIKDYVIPEGANIVIFIYCLHRDPNTFPDPLKFNPDRFLTKEIQNRHPYSYVPFSAGSRNCIGQKFAEMEEKVVLSHIIRNFKFTSLDSRDDIQIMGEIILRPKNRIKLKFTPRQKE